MIGNILALTNSTSNENIEVDGLLKKGLYNGNASDLKSEIDKKVSQEAGKGLSSNDYTNEEKQKNEENALKRVANVTVTGDVNKIITITFADSTVMQAPFKDNNDIPLADVHMNSLNFNENTGVLTGIKSDGNEISVSLDGRYSLIGHNHDEQYSPKTHTHSEYAYRTHRHNWDDIDGKPNNLATTESIKTAIEEIQVGGRNLLRGTSNFELKTEPFYLQANYAGNVGIVSETFMKNKVYKLIYNWQGFQCKTTFEDRPMIISFFAKTTKQNIKFTGVTDNYIEFINGNTLISDGKWHKYAIRKNSRIVTSNSGNNGFVEFYYEGGSKHIEEVYVSSFKFEYGNTPTDWSPAPEDFVRTENLMRKITRTGYETSTSIVVPQAQQNDTIFVKASCTLGLQNIENMGSTSFRKVFDEGAVTFTCAGKNIIYTGDNAFNGKKGSTAVVSIYNNDCFIDIRNI